MLAVFNSFVFDYVARQKIPGLHLNYVHVRQLPVLTGTAFSSRCPWYPKVTVGEWILNRVIRLSYTSKDVTSMARELGYEGSPYKWNANQRISIRSELDAAFFRLYEIQRDDVDYIMETFPIVKRKDIAEHGEYRTKRLILEIFDAMAEAEATGVPYASPFDKVGTQ